MARPQRRRRICREPEYRQFQPDGIGAGEEVNLTCDEFEIIRLVDHLRLTHEQAAKRMDISRTTATEVYESARGKLADAIVSGKALPIGGGAINALPNAGIDLYPGIDGRAAMAVMQLIHGVLPKRTDVRCNHHHHHDGDHDCGSHGHDCGSHEHTCGDHGCH